MFLKWISVKSTSYLREEEPETLCEDTTSGKMAEEDAWDAEDFQPELPPRPVTDDKWEGEDEDEEVKESWEDANDDDSEKKEQESGGAAYQRPKKKPLAERIAEKEVGKKKEIEEKKAKEKEEKRDLNPAERLAEKIRLQKIQEQESLSLAKGLFGMTETSLDKMMPATEEDFNQFSDALKSRITFFEDSPYYPVFIVKFISELSVGLGLEEVRKLGIHLNSLYHEKDRAKKEADKKKKQRKPKATIKVDKVDDLDLIGDAAGGGYAYDDDDFI